MKCKKIFQILPIACILTSISGIGIAQTWLPNHSIGTVNGIYAYGYNQTPAQLVELFPVANPNTGFTYIWESCPSPVFQSPFTVTTVASTASYSPPALTASSQTLYYRRKSTYTSNGSFVYSNIIKITVVSTGWEDMNYIREHDVLTTGITTWTAVDQLAIGSKLQTTTYLDGLGRSQQQVSRETATPSSGTLWGDVVQFSQYDAMGREPKKYLPYTTTNQSGKYKTAPLTDQPVYYTAAYNETAAFSNITFDNSPLNRVKNVKESGTSWAASAGNAVTYDVNTTADNVQIWAVDYVQGNAPVNKGAYPANTLYKLVYADVNGKQVVEYTNKSGQQILKKVQIDNVPTAGHTGWICTYSIYDEFGLLRYQLQPEAVKYLEANAWSFAGVNGTQVLNELCFQYNYDDKGRTIWKKAPGAMALNMLYDARDRVVFMQDGNQATLATPQWTSNLYDELDRPLVTLLYNTVSTIATLQGNINSAGATGIFTIPNTGIAAVTVTASLNPITSANLTNASVCTPLKYLFYDNYTFPLVKTFNTGFTNTTAYSTSDPNVIPIATSQRVTSMPTGSMTRVLGGNMFIATTHYYDELGQHIQTLEDNIKTGTDITTLQYHFDGRVLSTCGDHTTAGTGYTNFKTLTKYLFDKLGRVTSIQKTYGTNPAKTIASYVYDDMGRVKTKNLDPSYSNALNGLTGLESLGYTFNIHNQITGINKDYALKTAVYNKWSHYFGMYLGFDNRDAVFTSAQLNGQVTGIVWNSMGDDAQRRYNYSYDNAGRLINAAYSEKEKTPDAWANTKMDFSVTGTSGQITYDLNGNLLTMLQKGVRPGTATPLIVDDLRYTYASLSNKLQSVSDLMPTTAINGQFGDLKDGANGSNPDYVYDNNGNLVIDLNKNVQSVNGGAVGTKGIVYNYLDKPELIRIVGKGTVRVVYSADGEKLQRTFIPEAGGASTITTYINEFVYTETATITTATIPPLGGGGATLSYINFEEGRIRVITPTSQDNGMDVLTVAGNLVLPNSKSGAFDYFIMDYQQNVRMILTEETHIAGNTATMEDTRAAVEEPVFGQTGAANELASTRVVKPAAWTGNTSAKVSRLGNLAGKNIGPNTLQKVMAGDQVVATGRYYYDPPSGGDNPNIVNTVLSSLIQAITGGSAANSLVKGNTAAINSQLAGTTNFVNTVRPAGSGGNTPQAYMTVIFFDERFNFIAAADGGVAQQQVASTITAAGAPFNPISIRAPKNGYAFVYLSNRSDQHVYFDDFKVTISTANIIEENHYYSYGMKIAAISSKKLQDTYEGLIKNSNLYNDKELWDDGDLNWYDYGFRNYDPQIGRFTQLDPLTDQYPEFAPYQYASCDPIANIDLDGLEGLEVLETTGVFLDKAGNVAMKVGEEAIVKAVTKKVVEQVVKKGGFFRGVGRFFKGAAEGLIETATAAINVFNPDLSKNTLVQTGKFIVNTIKDPVGTVKGIVQAIKETDWSDPASYGKIASSLITPGAALKVVKFIGKASKITKAGNLASKVKNVIKKVANCGCFVAGTLVLTDGGYKKIEEIKRGDIVWAYNDSTEQYAKKKVKNVFEYIRDTIYIIQIDKEIIRATSDHPFFIAGRWLNVSDLKVGDSVVTYDGKKLVISGIEKIAKRTKVYNFEVEDFHTYYVSEQKILVHNSIPCPNGLINMTERGATKAFKGKAGVYEHYYKNTTSGEIASEINSYTGKTIDLGGSRPGKSRRVRGRQAGEEYEYMGSRFTEYNGNSNRGLAELEKSLLDANDKAGYRVLNKNDIHPQNIKE